MEAHIHGLQALSPDGQWTDVLGIQEDNHPLENGVPRMRDEYLTVSYLKNLSNELGASEVFILLLRYYVIYLNLISPGLLSRLVTKRSLNLLNNLIGQFIHHSQRTQVLIHLLNTGGTGDHR